MNISLSNIRFNNTLPFRSTAPIATVQAPLKNEPSNAPAPVPIEREIRTNPAQLSLLHMHDFHGQNIRMERAYSAVRQFDNNLIKNQNAVFDESMPVDKLKFCSGDMFLGANKKELEVVNEFLNIAGVLANTIGNHECDENVNGFEDVVKYRNYRLLGANMHPDDNNTMNVIKSNSFIAKIHGNQYGVIGLVPVDMRDHVKMQEEIDKFNISDMEGTLRDLQQNIDALKEYGVNKIILLSHMGLKNDQYIAQNVSDIDIILGGHSHDLMKEVKKGKNLFNSPKGEPVLIMQVGRDGEYLGIPNIKFNELGQITGIQYNVLKTDKFPRDYVAKVDFENILGKPDVVGYVSEVGDLPENIYMEENPHCDFIVDSLKSEFGTDIALMNSANIRSFFSIGEIDTRGLRLMTPFANKMVIIEMSEKELVDGLNRLIETTLKSPDHRPGIMQVSGLEYTYSKSKGKMTELYYINKEGKREKIDLNNPSKDRTFTVVADDFCVINDYAGLDVKHRMDSAIAIFDSDKDKFVGDYMKKQNSPAQIKTDGRIKVVD